MDELNQFKSLAVKKKVDAMEAYLIGINGNRYNMQEVGARVFGDENYSFTVSLIHRCYNFSGQNGGKYRNGCKFEQMYGYRVTRKDIEAFVRKYPNGTVSQGNKFEDFLKARASSSSTKKSASKPQKQTPQRNAQPTKRTQPTRQTQSTANFTSNQYSSGYNSYDEEKLKLTMIAVGSIGALILLMLLLTGNLFRHRIISFIVFIFTLGAFFTYRDAN